MRKTARTAEREKAIAEFRKLAKEIAEEIKSGKADARLHLALQIAAIARYSPLNQLLIMAQCPQVSEVHGYQEWRSLGYQVRKGEQGIRIVAPHQYERDGEEKTGFHSVCVFDRSQVDEITAEGGTNDQGTV